MRAYKCDLCLKYCDYTYVVDLPNVESDEKNSESRQVKEICEECCDKLDQWTQQNAVLGHENE